MYVEPNTFLSANHAQEAGRGVACARCVFEIVSCSWLILCRPVETCPAWPLAAWLSLEVTSPCQYFSLVMSIDCFEGGN